MRHLAAGGINSTLYPTRTNGFYNEEFKDLVRRAGAPINTGSEATRRSPMLVGI